VELIESKISGLVHVTQLPNDYYHFDPQRRLMRGDRHGLELRLGDPVRVLVLRASLEERKIDFRLVEHKDDAIESRAPSKREGRREEAQRAGKPDRSGKSTKAGKPGKSDKNSSRGRKR